MILASLVIMHPLSLCTPLVPERIISPLISENLRCSFFFLAGIPLTQHLGNSLPAWSMSKRNRSEVFADWIFNRTTQCKMGDPDNSVCRMVLSNETTCKDTFTSSSLPNTCSQPRIGETVAVNVWLGGDFNPFEGCDTRTGGETFQREGVNEHIDISCNPLICPQNQGDIRLNAYYNRMPNLQTCLDENQNMVTRGNVIHTYKNNLCRRKPPDVQERGCSLEQGQAKQGLVGIPANDLYETPDASYHTPTLANMGQGLFLHGGNPIYYTAKGSEEEIKVNILSFLLSDHI